MPQHGSSNDSTSRYESATTVYHDGQECIRVEEEQRKHLGMARKVVIGVLIVLIAVLLAVGAYLLWFSAQLNNRISLGEDHDEIVTALTDKSGVYKDPNDKGYYVLLIGSDSRMTEEELADFEFVDGEYTNQRSDIMVLVRIDEYAKKVTLLTIPRDTPWINDEGKWGKLNAVYSTHGAAGIIAAVEQITNVPISHYAEVHIAEFPKLIDAIGGITVDVPIAMSGRNRETGEMIYLNPGVQRLNGQEAMLVAQQRKQYSSYPDVNRQKAVRQVLQAIYQEITSKSAWEISEVVLACAECVTTDMDAVSIAQAFLALGSDVELYQATGPHEGDYNPYADGAFLCYQDPEGWARVMDVVRSGGDPSTVTYENDKVIVAGDSE